MTSFPVSKKISISRKWCVIEQNIQLTITMKLGSIYNLYYWKRQACDLISSVRPCGLIGTVLVNKHAWRELRGLRGNEGLRVFAAPSARLPGVGGFARSAISWRSCAKRSSLRSAPEPGWGCVSFKHPTLYLIKSSGVHYNLATVSLVNSVEEWNRMKCITLYTGPTN